MFHNETGATGFYRFFGCKGAAQYIRKALSNFNQRFLKREREYSTHPKRRIH